MDEKLLRLSQEAFIDGEGRVTTRKVETSTHYIFEFEIPGLPKTTNSGGRDHWKAKAREAKKWKSMVAIVVSKPPSPLTKARLTLTRCSSGECDFDGLVSSFKHVIDGLVDAGVIVNDKFSAIGQPTYQMEKASPGKGKIKVKVEQL